MESDLITVTADLIEAGRDGDFGWSRAQLAILGAPYPPKGPWKRRAVGRPIPRAEAERFVALRGLMELTVRSKRVAWWTSNGLTYLFPKRVVIPAKYHGTYLVPRRGIRSGDQAMLDQFAEWVRNGWRVGP